MDYVKLGKRLKEARIKMDLTQEQLAEAVGLSTNHISHIETGNTKLSLESLLLICNALNTTPDFVLFDSIYKSEEYMKEEIAVLTKNASRDEIQLITKLIAAVMNK